MLIYKRLNKEEDFTVMSADIALSAKKRDLLGKKVKHLRTDGQIPGVVHDRGKDSVIVSINEAEFKKVYSAAGKHHPVQLKVDGKTYTTLIREVTNKPAASPILHAVFQAIKADEKVSAELPIKLTEDIPAERASLLVLKNLDHIMVEALPKDLIDSVEVDANSLAEVGDKLHVSDIKLPDTITIKTDPETVIAAVEMPKDQVAEADAALEETAAQEGASAEDAEGEPTVEGAEGEAEKTEESSESSDSKEPKESPKED